MATPQVDSDPWADSFLPTPGAPAAVKIEPIQRPAAVPLVSTPASPQRVSTYQIQQNDQVLRFLEQFQTGYRRAVVERWLTRSGRFLPMALDIFRQKGLPEELVFTAMIESGFDPVAVSHAGAKGLWQFMAPTARQYGLRVDRWLDERLDPEKATVAAANYLTRPLQDLRLLGARAGRVQRGRDEGPAGDPGHGHPRLLEPRRTAGSCATRPRTSCRPSTR